MKRRKEQNIDWLLIVLFVAIAIIGWVNIYAASITERSTGIFDLSTSYGKQMLWMGISFVSAFMIMKLDVKFFPTFSYPLYILAILLLIAVLAVGQTVYGSKSWFVITDSIRFQPSEFAKFTTGLALAKYMSNRFFSFNKPKDLMIIAGIYLTPVLLIFLQNDTGSALIYAAFFLVFYREGLHGGFLVVGVWIIILFILTILLGSNWVFTALGILLFLTILLFRKNKKLILFSVFVALVSAGTVKSVDFVVNDILQPHQRIRILVLLGLEKDLRGAGYNVHQSKIAIGSGGLTGKGFLQGTQTKLNFVPKQNTDFIFSTVGEEWGFIGTSTVVLLFTLLFIKIIVNAEKQRSAFSRIYGYCVASVLFMHFTLNIGMTIGLAPTIGVPLPLISYGGSSLLSFTILFFVFVKLDANKNLIVW